MPARPSQVAASNFDFHDRHGPASEEIRLLANLLQKVWTSRLKKQNESIRFALEVATDLGLRNFMADLYYVQLTRMKPTYSSVTSLAYAHPVNDLTPEQNLNLYKGFWSLYYYWVGTYNAYQVNDICDCGHECQATWKECWNEIYTKPSATFDPLDLVQQLEGILGTHAPNGEIELHLKCAHEELTDLRSTLITTVPFRMVRPSRVPRQVAMAEIGPLSHVPGIMATVKKRIEKG